MPPATASPAEAAVCTALFSRIVECLKKRKMPMEIMAAGIEAEVRIPSFKARNVLEIAKITVNIIASKMLRNVNSAMFCSAEIKGFIKFYSKAGTVFGGMSHDE